MVNMNGSGVYLVITPITSVVAPTAGGFTTGFSNSTCRSALLFFWLSSVMAASRLSLVAEITFTGIFSCGSHGRRLHHRLFKFNVQVSFIIFLVVVGDGRFKAVLGGRDYLHRNLQPGLSAFFLVLNGLPGLIGRLLIGG